MDSWLPFTFGLYRNQFPKSAEYSWNNVWQGTSETIVTDMLHTRLAIKTSILYMLYQKWGSFMFWHCVLKSFSFQFWWGSAPSSLHKTPIQDWNVSLWESNVQRDAWFVSDKESMCTNSIHLLISLVTKVVVFF